MSMIARRALVVFLAVAGASGCKRGAKRQAEAIAGQPVKLQAVTVSVRTPPSARVQGINQKTARSRVEKAIGEAPWVSLDSSSKGATLAVELAAGLRRTRAEAEEFVAIVTVRAPGVVKGQALEASTVAPLREKGKPVPRPSEALRRRHIWRTLDHALASWLHQAKLVGADEEALVAALGDHDPDRLLSAIEISALRKSNAAVPALIGLLSHKERRLADRSIGALVIIGDRRAVKPLTKLAKFEDSGRVAQVIDAIGSLGGEEAKAFLEFVADGHRNPTVRDMARQALARMTRADPT
ncbi:MAG: hypothetical protein CSA65_00740 [Proteobacteria bacterium]|nr:MAG: hypothetical protein CSB49_07575 [Pseudomonadota bacterium]PIE19820.1 MAG: hypothetical protein CSA65_00740 [Pseudomonadota bacterium]